MSRSKSFADEMKGRFDPRQVPVVRPGVPEPMIAADAPAPPRPGLPRAAASVVAHKH